MAKETTLVKLRKIVNEHLGRQATEQLGDSDDLIAAGADSLDTVEIVMASEEAFGIELPDDEVEKIQTISDLAELIEKQIPDDNAQE